MLICPSPSPLYPHPYLFTPSSRTLILIRRASPRLKDAVIPQEDVRRLYIEILVLLRVIFHRCKLVHADFSEYNILWVCALARRGREGGGGRETGALTLSLIRITCSLNPCLPPYHLYLLSLAISLTRRRLPFSLAPRRSPSFGAPLPPSPALLAFHLAHSTPNSYHLSHLYVIDVSQSVEQDHPSAFDFLRSDIKNADDFFARRGVDTLGLTRTFNFVTRPSWVKGEETDEVVSEEAERLLAEVEAAEGEEEEEEVDPSATSKKQPTAGKKDKPTASDEAVFAQSYIPRALDQVYDIERDVARVLRGEGEDLIYADITGVADIRKKEGGVRFDDEEGAVKEEGGEGEEDSGSESGSDEGSDSEGEEGEDGYKERRPRGKKHEGKEEKKVRLSFPFLLSSSSRELEVDPPSLHRNAVKRQKKQQGTSGRAR